MSLASLLLAWRPFLDPMDLHEYWWAFLFPLSLGIAIAYKAVRLRDLEGYLRQVIIMTAQIVLSMILLGIACFLLLEYVFPLIVPMEM
jgi:hypothetical protein